MNQIKTQEETNKHSKFKLKQGINILSGENGSGKTRYALEYLAERFDFSNTQENIDFFWKKLNKEEPLLPKSLNYISYSSATRLLKNNEYYSGIRSANEFWQDISQYLKSLHEFNKNQRKQVQRNDWSYHENKPKLSINHEKNSNEISVLANKLRLKLDSEFSSLEKTGEKLERLLTIIFEEFYEKYVKILFEKKETHSFFHYCWHYYDYLDFLKKFSNAFQAENDKLRVLAWSEQKIKKFKKKNSADPLKVINNLIYKIKPNLRVGIETIQEKTFNGPFLNSLLFKNKDKNLSFNNFSSGERTLFTLINKIVYFQHFNKINKDEKCIFFFDEFDAFLNPNQAKDLVENLKKIHFEDYIVLVSQNPTTIVQFDSNFNYLLAENNEVNLSNKDEIMKVLLRKTPDLSVYKIDKFFCFVEGKSKGYDESFYKKIWKLLKFEEKQLSFVPIPVGSKDNIRKIFCNKRDFPPNMIGIIDGDGEDKKRGKSLVFSTEKYYAIENILFSSPLIVSLFEKNSDKWDQQIKTYTEEIKNIKKTLKNIGFCNQYFFKIKEESSVNMKNYLYKLPTWIVEEKIEDCILHLLLKKINYLFKLKLNVDSFLYSDIRNFISNKIINKIDENTLLPLEVLYLFRKIKPNSE